VVKTKPSISLLISMTVTAVIQTIPVPEQFMVCNYWAVKCKQWFQSLQQVSYQLQWCKSLNHLRGYLLASGTHCTLYNHNLRYQEGSSDANSSNDYQIDIINISLASSWT